MLISCAVTAQLICIFVEIKFCLPVSDTEKVISLGSLVGKLSSGTGTIAGFKEDKRNKMAQSKLKNGCVI